MKNRKKVILCAILSSFMAFSIPALKDGRVKDFINKLTVAKAGTIENYSGTYYDSCDTSVTGDSLVRNLSALITSTHSEKSYSALWDAYKTTDIKEGTTNKIWDMYSNCDYTVSTNQCGNYSGEGSCYNREHSIPKSWFNDASPMYSDIYHLYPTDGYVNSKRSNYPFGDVSEPTYTSGNGSLLGSCSSKYYSGKTVFEPIDEYKGDFARTYFYMVTRYYSQLGSWTGGNGQDVFKSSFPYLTDFALDTYYRWHLQDPVSQKEITRNNAAYQFQGNRNPFIDNPQWAAEIFKSSYLALGNVDTGEGGTTSSSSSSSSSSQSSSSSSSSTTSSSIIEDPSGEIGEQGNITITGTSPFSATPQTSTSIDVTDYFTKSNVIKSVTWNANDKPNLYIKSGGFRLYNCGGNGSELVIEANSNYEFTNCTVDKSTDIKITSLENGTKYSIKNVSNATSGNVEISKITLSYKAKNSSSGGTQDSYFKDINTTSQLSNSYVLDSSSSVTYTEISTTSTDYTFTGNQSGEIKIKYNITTGKALYLKKIKVITENETYEHTFTSSMELGSNSLSNKSWNLNTDAGYFGKDSTRGTQIGSKNNPATNLELTSSNFEGKIKSITINTCHQDGFKGNLVMSVNDTPYSYGDPISNYYITKANIFYGVKIPVDTYNTILEKDSNATFGLLVFNGNSISDNSEPISLLNSTDSISDYKTSLESKYGTIIDYNSTADSYKNIKMEPTICSTGEYQYGIKFNYSDLSTQSEVKLCAIAYVIVDGVPYLANATNYSLISLATKLSSLISDQTSVDYLVLQAIINKQFK